MHRNAFRTRVLTIVWLFTAALALVLSVFYFDKLQRLYAQVEDTQARAVGKKTEQTAAGQSLSSAQDKADSGLREGTDSADTVKAGDKKAGSKTTDNGKGSPVNGDIAGPADSEDFEGYDNTGPKEPEKPDSAEAGTAYEKTFDYTTGVDPEKPIIALSFDDGPSVFTERIVAALQKNHVSATFFMVGYNVENHKSMVRLVYDSGFELGNHTKDHKRLTDLSRKDMAEEVFGNEDLINSIVPAGEIIVRPPYGSYNETVSTAVQRPMFNWSVDSQDWKTRDADSVVAQIKKDAKDGYIILMHDLYESTAEATERIVPWLLDQGYQVTDISTMFKARGITPEKGELYRYAPEADE